MSVRGGEWYLEKRGSRKILAGSRNLGRVFDKSRSLVFGWFVFTSFESRNFLPKSLGLGFLTRISASRRVSDFTIRHPFSLTTEPDVIRVRTAKGQLCHYYINSVYLCASNITLEFFLDGIEITSFN